MINKLKYATISDIGVTDLMFYNPDTILEQIKFCQKNGITYLPARNRKTVYKLKKGGFHEFRLKEEYSVNPYDRIFDEETLEKFRKVNHNEIRFIIENDKIKGVVHIVDYNNEHLQVELFRAFFRFENFIRDILIRNKQENYDFIDWVKKNSADENLDRSDRLHWQGRLEEIKKKETAIKRSNPFQAFYLRDLMLFAKDIGTLEITYDDLSVVTSFRNDIAHSKDITTHKRDSSGVLLYNYNNLKRFVDKIKLFFRVYEDVEEHYNRLADDV